MVPWSFLGVLLEEVLGGNNPIRVPKDHRKFLKLVELGRILGSGSVALLEDSIWDT